MKFSVIIPSYNREQVVLRAVRSVLNQTFHDFEVVVVDDGSKDGTKQIVESIKDQRVKYVWQENQGATIARNTGIINAKGEYVSFLDSDDSWHPTMLEEQFVAYQENPEIGCVYSNVQIIGTDGIARPFSKPLGDCDNTYKEVLQQGYMAPTSVLSAKREALVKVGMFDTILPASQDDDICFKLAKSCKVHYIPKVLADMYVGQQNRISVNRDKVAKGWWMLWNKYEGDIVGLCGIERMRECYDNTTLRFVLAQNREYCRKSISKYEQFGGKLNSFKRTLINIGLLYKGKYLQYVCGKIIAKLWLI